MSKKNGKWVVGLLFLVVVALASLSLALKKDIMARAAEQEAAAAESR